MTGITEDRLLEKCDKLVPADCKQGSHRYKDNTDKEWIPAYYPQE